MSSMHAGRKFGFEQATTDASSVIADSQIDLRGDRHPARQSRTARLRGAFCGQARIRGKAARADRGRAGGDRAHPCAGRGLPGAISC
jgi:hypothetical protein